MGRHEERSGEYQRVTPRDVCRMAGLSGEGVEDGEGRFVFGDEALVARPAPSFEVMVQVVELVCNGYRAD